MDSRIVWPARAMVAYGLLSALSAAATVALTLLGAAALSALGASGVMDADPALQLAWQIIAPQDILGRILAVFWAGGQVLVAALILIGGWQFHVVGNRPIAILGAVLCLTPGATSCCIGPAGIIVGVWSLVVLFQEDIVDAFEGPMA